MPLSNSKAGDLFGPLDDELIPTLDEIGIAIYITDQSVQGVPKGCTPGFVVSVYRLQGKRPTTKLESMWNATPGQAEQIAQEYARQYLTMHACGW